MTSHEEVLNLHDSGDLEADLRDLARRLHARVMQPQLLQLHRLVIGEASRVPELGRTFSACSSPPTAGSDRCRRTC
jgi:hypothetical protein